jgi:hypothetical protein
MKTFLCILSLLATALLATAENIRVTWTAPFAAADGVTQFRIYLLGPTRTLLATVPGNMLEATVNLPPAPTPYVLVCRAANSTTESEDSNQLSVTVAFLHPPENLRRP